MNVSNVAVANAYDSAKKRRLPCVLETRVLDRGCSCRKRDWRQAEMVHEHFFFLKKENTRELPRRDLLPTP